MTHNDLAKASRSFSASFVDSGLRYGELPIRNMFGSAILADRTGRRLFSESRG